MSHPEIFVNGRFLTQRITGVQAFAHSVCDEMIRAGIPFKLLIPRQTLLHQAPSGIETISVGKLTGHLWEQIHLPAFIRDKKNTVLLNLCNSAPMQLTNQVVTLHDLAFFHHPEWFSMKFRLWYNYMIPRSVQSAKSILTVSETSAKAISEAYGVTQQKIYTTCNKVSSELLESEIDSGIGHQIQGRRFFLMVGSNDPRKNFTVAEKFIASFREDAVLVIAGGSHQSFSKNSHSHSERIIRLGYVNSGQLKWLYQNALALINASVYEGFGIPNLEAMSQGCPVICSDIPVFREVCSEAAFYFNENDPLSLQNQAELIDDHPTLVSSKKMIGNTIFTSYQNRDRTSVILKALSR
jgi:glycosyltransferase involved in cell wall biosynthesis